MAHYPDDESTIERYPLQWPMGWRRTRERRDGHFKAHGALITRALALNRLERELDRLGAENVVLSSNLRVRISGDVRLSDAEPDDPGVAIYFRFKGRATVMASDAFTDVAQNIAALAGHIEAIRRVDRYGVGSIEQALAGYKALPADTAADWRAVFGLPRDGRVTAADVEREFKRLARLKHPDQVGGSEIEMAHLTRARTFALDDLKGA